MRLFIALLPDKETVAALKDIQRQFRARGVRGGYTKEENLHITLAFIGEYAEPAKVLSVMRSVPFSASSVSLDRVGSFGDLYYAGLDVSGGLKEYAARLRRALDENGIPYDKKPFRPHITLLRRADRQPGGDITVRPVSCLSGRVSLMKSERGYGGMIYTEYGSVRAATGNKE